MSSTILLAQAPSLVRAALFLCLCVAPVFSGETSVFHRQVADGLPVRLDASGVEIQSTSLDGWVTRLTLTGFGREHELRTVPPSVPRLNQGRVQYDRGPLTEWWLCEGRGLRQGFDLKSPPSPQGSSPLALQLRISGDLLASVHDRGQRATLAAPGDVAVLALRGVVAWDARKRPLKAKLEGSADGRTLTLLVDDRYAIYPVTIDPLITDEIAEVTASNAAAKDQLGRAVSVHGDTLVAGAPQADGAKSNEGRAYVFERHLGGLDAWGERTLLQAFDADGGDEFGSAVAVSGDVAVVGAALDDDQGNASGAAYIFGRNQGGANAWGLVTKLLASGGGKGDQFGAAVALDGDTLAVGAPKEKVGRVYVHRRNQGGADAWGLVKIVVGASASNGDRFGTSVALEGNLLVVGSPNDDSVAANAGAAYVFERNLGGADNWGQRKKLTAPDGMAADQCGTVVDVTGNSVVLGAARSDDGGIGAGKAYLYLSDLGGPDNWGFFKLMQSAPVVAGNQFGVSVAMDGEALAIGAIGDDLMANNGGAVSVYSRNLGGVDVWGFVSKVGASNASNNDIFGQAASLHGTTLVVGAPQTDGAGSNSGSVYVFEVNVAPPPPASTQGVVLIDDGQSNLPIGNSADTRRVAWVDLDNNGLLDLFELNYLGFEGNLAQFQVSLGNFSTSSMLSAPTNALLGIDTSLPADGIPDALPAKGVAFGDWDNDGDQDAYLATGPLLGVPQRNWFVKNQTVEGTPGQFSVHAPGNGIDGDLDHSYDARFSDLNQDGFLDLVVVNRNESNRLYLNEGAALLGQFRPVSDAAASGLAAVSAMNPVNPLTDPFDSLGSRAVEVGDLDGDGDDDVFVVNANAGAQPNQVFVNQGGNQGGQPGDMLALTADDSVDLLGISYGLDLGDLDNDGDLDAFICNRNEVNHLLRNDSLPGGGPKFTRVVGTAVDLDQSGYLGTPVYGDSYDCDIADLDDDGDADIVVVNRVQRNLIYLATTAAPHLLDDPAGAYDRITQGPVQVDRGNTRAVAVADIDVYGPLVRSGVPELALANSGSGLNRYYQNYGRHIEALAGKTVLGSFDPYLWAEGVLSDTSDVTLNISSGQPSSAGEIVVGFAVLNAPFNGGVLVPSPDFSFPFATDAFGNASVLIPGAGIPTGSPVWFQGRVDDAGMAGQPNGSSSLSNPLVIIAE